MMIAQG